MHRVRYLISRLQFFFQDRNFQFRKTNATKDVGNKKKKKENTENKKRSYVQECTLQFYCYYY